MRDWKKLAKNPGCSYQQTVHCWHCGKKINERRNLAFHHSNHATDALHTGKDAAFYIWEQTGLFPAPGALPYVQGHESELAAADQPLEEQEYEEMESEKPEESQETEPKKDEEAEPEKVEEAKPEKVGTKRKKQPTLFSMFGAFREIKTSIQRIADDVSDYEVDNYLQKLVKAIEEVEELKSEMVRENKRMKLEGQKATDMQKSMEKAMNLLEYQRKVIEEKTAEVEQAVMKADLPSFQNVSPADLDGIPNNLHNMVKEVVETDGSIALKDGHFECEICKNNWSKVVPRKDSAPNYTFAIHVNSKQAIKNHQRTKTHLECFNAKLYFDESERHMRTMLENHQRKIDEMTCNVIRVVYFILKYDVSALQFEKLMNLLNCVNALIGNQLHGRTSASTIAKCLDENYMKILVAHLTSSKVKCFTMEFDEMTDKGNMKTLLSKIKFHENGHLQSFVFNIFESGGTSEDLHEKFVEDIYKNFQINGTNDEALAELLNDKFIAGTSDRASKILKVGNLFFDTLFKYIHICCDNHMTETAWKEAVKELPSLEAAKVLIKECYAMQSRSSKRTKELQKLAKEYDQKFLKLRTIFEVRFLTHAAKAVTAELTDHEQLLKISKELSKDTTVKAEKREEFDALHKKLKNSENFAEMIGLQLALDQALVPYQKMGQRDDICVFDRPYMRKKLRETAEALSDKIPENMNVHIEKIDFERKCWKKSGIHCNKLQTREEFETRVLSTRNEILETVLAKKDEIHEVNDTDEINELAHAIDMRLWEVPELYNSKDQNIEAVKVELKANISGRISESKDFLRGEDEAAFETSMNRVVEVVLQDYPTNKTHTNLAKKPTVAHQWKELRNHPELIEHETLWNMIDRATAISNHEAGCERSNSKYNRAKNDLSTRMGLEMILARMRVGSNGPPLHRFNAEKALAYWKENGHRFAQAESSGRDQSLTVMRLQKEEDEKYTSTIYL